MNRTKQQQLKLTYQRVMEVTLIDLNAPLHWVDDYVAENVCGHGTAADEKFNSRDEYRWIIINSRKQSKNISLKAKIITKYKPIFFGEHTAAFRDEVVVNIGKNKQAHILHVLVGSTYSYIDDRWQLIALSASVPDDNTSSTDTFHIADSEKKVKALEQTVAERTAEILEKNKELQIETALEKVRAVAMGMRIADDMLSICKIISEQLAELGVKDIRNVQTAIFYQDPGTYMNYEYYAKHNKTFITDVDFKNHKIQLAFAKKMLKGPNEEVIEHLKGKKLQDWYTYQKSTNQFADKYLLKAHSVNYYWYSIGPVALGISTYFPLTNEETNLFKRFLKVFELAYRRYLDIEKAEAQAREAQIEAALERVRAASMAMHSSQELKEVALELRKQMGLLGQKDLELCAIHLYDDKNTFESWSAMRSPGKETKILQTQARFPNKGIKIIDELLLNYKRGLKDYVLINEGKKSAEWLNVLKEYAPELHISIMKSIGKISRSHWSVADFNGGALVLVSYGEPDAPTRNLLRRSANAFEQAYTRFLDLKKAEAQAREAEIQLALERVRAASMAMRDSSALSAIINKVYTELTKLDAQLDRCFIMIVHPENKGITWWMAGHEGLLAENGFFIPANQHASHLWYLDCWKRKRKKWQYLLEGKEKKDWDRFGFKDTELAKLPEPVKKFMAAQKKVHLSGSSDQFGSLVTGSFEPLPEEQQNIISRFSIAFNQVYIRFLDLQKAETQAREAEIELALERVRARTMAMQYSDELADASFILDSQVRSLGIKTRGCAFNIYGENGSTEWFSSEAGTMPSYHTPRENIFLKYYEARLEGKAMHIESFEENTCAAHYDYLCTLPGAGESLKKFKESGGSFPKKQIDHVVYFKYGYLLFITLEPAPEAHEIFKRFAQVFEQTYTRFLDLQRAETQARESQIETALERVRRRTMAMQKSTELAETVQIMFEEFRNLQMDELNAIMSRGFITTINHNLKCFDLWITETDGSKLDTLFKIGFDEPTTGSVIYKAWKQQKPFLVSDLQEEQLNRWLDYLVKDGFKVAKNIRGTRRVNTFVYYSQGFIGITSSLPLTDEIIAMLQRFAKVFDQTYTRFLDLQTAEAAAKEAVKQAALDRIRANIASMRTKDDLNRITPVIWNELTILGIPFIRCGVFMMDEAKAQIHTFLSTPTGESIAAFKLRFDEFENIKTVVRHWQNKATYINHWGREEFSELAASLISQGAISNKEQYLHSLPKEGIHLNFIPFLQGMLYVGNTRPMPDQDIHLLQSVADAFSTAYARYEDFNKLEAAKEVVENTLEELKSTQAQLVQSEKMASLGELTAGIAHEIQNPLNFVNNFSEVSAEMVKEMVEEVEKGNNEEVKAIADDLKQNLEKIKHHGQRAADIVKGMLQHSRSSSGVKEPTDINALTDEYLRLAYHGLRAKDKSFNTIMKTDFDATIEKINIIPQDIGRVILNLITNAFYAVNEKAKQKIIGYQPTVTVSTRKTNTKVEIAVADNGNGIPQHIIDKIFQPFFTTKPSGQGTGLGLSLSYDIVKAHGGELKVETKVYEGNADTFGKGEGTIFTIVITA